MNMISRRHFLSVLAAVPAMGLIATACGSDTKSVGSEPQDSSGAGPAANPVGANDVVLRIDAGVGGFTTPEYSFGSLPSLLVMGDGRAFSIGPVPAIYPGPMLVPVLLSKLSEAKVAELVTLATDAGLTGEIPNYETGQPNVTDVGSVIVTINSGGTTYEHSAYALGFEGESGEPRKKLKAFVDAALATDLGATEMYTPEQYAIWARPMSLADFAGVDPQPPVIPWPITTIDLTADAATCLAVNATDVQIAFEAATQNTLWEQNGATYAIAVRTVLPGTAACG
jgi:hypothetical protein